MSIKITDATQVIPVSYQKVANYVLKVKNQCFLLLEFAMLTVIIVLYLMKKR